MPPLPPGGGGDAPGANPPESDGASLFTALQEQLGLKLEQKKGPLDLVVIDRSEKIPVENRPRRTLGCSRELRGKPGRACPAPTDHERAL